MTTTAGSPNAAIVRYRMPCDVASGPAPRRETIDEAKGTSAAHANMPMMTPSRSACCANAPERASFCAPRALAMRSVVPYARKFVPATISAKMVPAAARPASSSAPTRPIMAVSVATYSGSTARVPSAGRARRNSRRSTCCRLSEEGVASAGEEPNSFVRSAQCCCSLLLCSIRTDIEQPLQFARVVHQLAIPVLNWLKHRNHG